MTVWMQRDHAERRIDGPGGLFALSVVDLSGNNIDLINGPIHKSSGEASSLDDCREFAKALEKSQGLRSNWQCRNERGDSVFLSGCEFLQSCAMSPLPSGSPTPRDTMASASDGRCMSECRNTPPTPTGFCEVVNPWVRIFNANMRTFCSVLPQDRCTGDCGWTDTTPPYAGCEGESETNISTWCTQFQSRAECDLSRDPGVGLQTGAPYCKWYINGDGPPPLVASKNFDPCAQLKRLNC